MESSYVNITSSWSERDLVAGVGVP